MWLSILDSFSTISVSSPALLYCCECWKCRKHQQILAWSAPQRPTRLACLKTSSAIRSSRYGYCKYSPHQELAIKRFKRASDGGTLGSLHQKLMAWILLIMLCAGCHEMLTMALVMQVLNFEITGSAFVQFFVCVAGVFACGVTHDFVQEVVFRYDKFDYGWFMTLWCDGTSRTHTRISYHEHDMSVHPALKFLRMYSSIFSHCLDLNVIRCLCVFVASLFSWWRTGSC